MNTRKRSLAAAPKTAIFRAPTGKMIKLTLGSQEVIENKRKSQNQPSQEQPKKPKKTFKSTRRDPTLGFQMQFSYPRLSALIRGETLLPGLSAAKSSAPRFDALTYVCYCG
jgi:hypothetical protein